MNSFAEVVQQYGPLFGILAAVAGILGLAFKIYKSASMWPRCRPTTAR